MRRYLGRVALLFALAATAGAKEPTADDALLDWTCSADNVPRLPAPPVDLPEIAQFTSRRPTVGTLVFVAADGSIRTAQLPVEDGATVVVADRAAPAKGVVAEILRTEADFVAVAPAGSVEPPPIGADLVAAMAGMCPGGALRKAELGGASSRCTQFRLPLRDLPGACDERADLLARVIRACPDERADVLAYQLCRTHTSAEGEATLLARVPRRAGAALPTAVRWEDAWYGVVRHGIPLDPSAPPDPEEVAAPPFALADELEAKKQVMPKYPSEATQGGYADQRCLATITIDADGSATEVEVDGCPEVFHEAAGDALIRWKWSPPVVDGKPGPVRTTVGIAFKLR